MHSQAPAYYTTNSTHSCAHVLVYSTQAICYVQLPLNSLLNRKQLYVLNLCADRTWVFDVPDISRRTELSYTKEKIKLNIANLLRFIENSLSLINHVHVHLIGNL